MFNNWRNGGLSGLWSDRQGNFSVITAFILPVSLAAAGMAVDVSGLMAAKAKLQSAADAAAVAAGAALVNDKVTIDQAKTIALNFVKGQMSGELSAIAQAQADAQAEGKASIFDGFDIGNCTNVDIQQATTTGTAKSYTVTVNTCLDVELTAMAAVIGSQAKQVDVASTTVSDSASKTALSMYLVLDRSGSMGENTTTVTGTETYYYSCGWRRTCTGTRNTYLTKIDALKQAAGNLLTQITTADPNAYYARMGSVSYNSYTDTAQSLGWGTTSVSNYVNALYANGGTDSSNAFKTAYQSLIASTEDAAHLQKNGQKPDKYIVFMTDGANNYSTADTATKKWCDAAKADGIQVYSIAFMAPDQGKALLSYCATDADHYFAAEDAETMIAAFEYIGEKATKPTTRLTQ